MDGGYATHAATYQDGDQRSDMQGDIEGQSSVFPAQQPRREGQMRGAADGQKLRDGLYQRKNNYLIDGHDGRMDSITVLCPIPKS